MDDIKNHKMHSEQYEIDPKTVDKIKHAKANGGRIVAVGTTAVRTLESASTGGELKSQKGDTDFAASPKPRSIK